MSEGRAAPRLFLSHASADKGEVQALRGALSDRGIAAWEDVLELRLGGGLDAISKGIAGCDGFVLLLTPASIGSEWVQKEVAWALAEKAKRPGYLLLPILRGLDRGALKLFGAAEIVSISLGDGDRIDTAVPAIVQALGLAFGDRSPRPDPIPEPPIADLAIEIIEPRTVATGGTNRGAGRMRLVYWPAGNAREHSSPYVDFVAPVGPIEADDLRWYLESYLHWPFGVFRKRAQSIEASLPVWGRDLFDAIASSRDHERVFEAWRDAKGMTPGERVARRITITVDDRGGSDAEQKARSEAAATLFGLPWELLHDTRGYLFDGGLGARVRRKLPSEGAMVAAEPRLPLRILVVLARPEEEGVGFLDPRASTTPLAEALADLGTDVSLTVLPDGTLGALRVALEDAVNQGAPYQVVHFDGHGVYDPRRGLGQLCFEDASDAREGLAKRKVDLVDAPKLGGMLRERRVALFVLEACQTAMTEKNPTASVAGELLKAGVASVVAMSHSVLVATASRFVAAFYGSLAKGERIGTAMVRAQSALMRDPKRSANLELQDWFVPVLFQEDADARLFPHGVDARPASIADRKLATREREGALPGQAAHGFVGRARALLAIDRKLHGGSARPVRLRYVTIQGTGGMGKTALATEAARWLVSMRRCDRVAFVSVEHVSEARAVIDAIGSQLVPGYSVAEQEGAGSDGEKRARSLLRIKHVLAERRVLLVVDNLESVLPRAGEAGDVLATEVFQLLRELVDVGGTRLILTSREALPAPFGGGVLVLPALAPYEAKELITAVVRAAGIEPDGKADDLDAKIEKLVDAVGGHARSLVLLAPLVAQRGFAATTEEVRREMVALEARYPEERDRSLIASVRLSLAKLDPNLRAKLGGLAVFHGPTTVANIAHVLQVEPSESLTICRQLIAVGMADADGTYLLPDPGLAAALSSELDPAGREGAEARWLEATVDLVKFLYQQLFEDAQVAFHGTRLALADLLAALETLKRNVTADSSDRAAASAYVTNLESLVSPLGLPRVLAQVADARRWIAERLPVWCHARFEAESAEVDRKRKAGDRAGALKEAISLRDRAFAAGDAYPEAAYDRASASFRLGRVLKDENADEALLLLDEARLGFAAVAAAGNRSAAQMESAAITEMGDALRGLGRFDQAAAAYEESAKRDIELGDKRGAAVSRGQLGTVRKAQGRYTEALAAYEDARATFEGLGEPASVAVTWHQIGMVHATSGSFDRAEGAYRKSLAIKAAQGNRAGEAATLDELGSLYDDAGRLEDAVAFYRQSIDLRHKLGNAFSEGGSLNNLGIVLRKLRRFDEAREALEAAITTRGAYGHAAQPWMTWGALAELERDAQRPDAARKAREQAIASYRAYRDAGGEPTDGPTGFVVAFGQTLRKPDPDAARAMLPDPTEAAAEFAPTLPALHAIADGSRDPALAADPAHHPFYAVELALLLASLPPT